MAQRPQQVQRVRQETPRAVVRVVVAEGQPSQRLLQEQSVVRVDVAAAVAVVGAAA